MKTFKVIEHKFLEQEVLESIIEIKSVRWAYSKAEHLAWINENISENDYHVIMFDDDQIVGYLNLVRGEVQINKKKLSFLGVGNVCTKKSGFGYGKDILEFTNEIISSTDKVGILFCKDHLLNFYRKYGWQLIEKMKVRLLNDNQLYINTMVFNFPSSVEELIYLGKIF